MLSPSIHCEGQLQINGDIVGATISLRNIDNETLLLDDGERRSLLVRSFFKTLLSWEFPAEKKLIVDLAGFGENGASWSWGPLGHPGDGEFESRGVKCLSVQVFCAQEILNISLSGETEHGVALYKGQPDPEHPEPLPPWRFDVEFRLSAQEWNSLIGDNRNFRKSFVVVPR